MFESIGWKPTAGLGGFLGGNAYAQDITRGLQDLVQSKEKHDITMLDDRLKYDIRRNEEDAYGQLKRDTTKQELEEKKKRIPLETEILAEQNRSTKVLTDNAIAAEKRRVDETNRKKIEDRMDSMEEAYQQLFQTMGPEMNVTDLYPNLRSNLMQTLLDGGWEEKDIPQDNESLRAWIIQGRQRAIVDRRRLKEGRTHYYQTSLQDTRNAGTLAAAQTRIQASLNKFDPTNRLRELEIKAAQQGGLDPVERAEQDFLMDVLELKAKETAAAKVTGTLSALQGAQGGTVAPPVSPFKRANPLPQGGTPTPQPTPTTQPQIKFSDPSINEALKVGYGTMEKPIPLVKPEDAKLLPKGVYYKDIAGKTRGPTK